MANQLKERLDEIVKIFHGQTFIKQEYRASGFQSILDFWSTDMVGTVLGAAQNYPVTPFLDVCAGNAAPGLLFAGAGFPSYNIEANERLVDRAWENYRKAVLEGLVDSSVPFAIALGNCFSPDWNSRAELFNQTQLSGQNGSYLEKNTHYLPLSQGPTPQLEIGVQDAGIIYCWPSPVAMPLFYDFFAEKASPDARFILPHIKMGTDNSVFTFASINQYAARQHGLDMRPEFADGKSFVIYRRSESPAIEQRAALVR